MVQVIQRKRGHSCERPLLVSPSADDGGKRVASADTRHAIRTRIHPPCAVPVHGARGPHDLFDTIPVGVTHEQHGLEPTEAVHHPAIAVHRIGVCRFFLDREAATRYMGPFGPRTGCKAGSVRSP